MKDPILINREISWLYFNERVLQEAIDESNPLIERVKFLGIFSNNRDEFFRVRVATLRRVLNFEKSKGIEDPNVESVLQEIANIVEKQENIFTSAYEHIVRLLAEKDIYIINEKQLTPAQGRVVQSHFQDEVRPHLFPLMLDNSTDLSILKDETIHLAVQLSHSHNRQKENFAIISLPITVVPRFLLLPPEGEKKYVIILDDVIRYCLNEIFSVFGYDRFNAYTIKFTRDAELDIDNDVSKSFMELMSESVKKRKKGEAVRFVYDKQIPEALLKRISKKLNITKRDHTRAGGRYHNFKDFMSFPRVGPADLVYPFTPPLPHKDLPRNRSIIEIIKHKDVMLHYPYQTFQYVIDFLREASIDPRVRAIKMTFYRAAKDSSVMNALINAVRNGKQVTVFLELQARFDEEANIYWTGKLQEEGIKIIQSIPGFKVHSKLILVRRKEQGAHCYYANISTGNYNESTAKLYADDSLFTGNQEITAEVNKVFHLFESKFIMPTFSTLIVAPFYIRNFFIRMLEDEIANARAGKEAWVILKMNSLSDKKIVPKIYEASQAGVKIQLIVRGICILVPGVEGMSENIEVISIVDKFLEHSRVYVFCHGGDNRYFISSADWMTRNFDHRVELACPIYDKDIQQELMDMLQIQLRDNTKARLLGPENLNHYKKSGGSASHRSQFETYAYFKNMLDAESK
ncbi:MAG: polyphosphate kinase 1 [Bacteroidales bacterium]